MHDEAEALAGYVRLAKSELDDHAQRAVVRMTIVQRGRGDVRRRER